MKKTNKDKIIFIGGLTNGIEVLNYLKKKKIFIPYIFTYPKKYKNKPRYMEIRKQSFPQSKIVQTKNINKYYSEIKKIKPNIIIVTGWSYMIPQKILDLAKHGVIGFHPSKLPLDRGRSVLAWQIEEGYRETALTMFYMTNKPDAGDIIDSKKILISKKNYINDILNKIDKASYHLIKSNLKKIIKKRAKAKKQNNSLASYRKLRDKLNQIIDWSQNYEKIYNKVRAISKPYPGAIGYINKKPFRIWSIRIANFRKKQSKHIYVKCKDKLIEITNFDKIKKNAIL